MSTASRPAPVSVADYLAGEADADRRHEYVAGIVYGMVGGSNAHNLVATNITGLLHGQLRGGPCRVFNADTKVRIESRSGTRFYYPDASVVCQPNPATDTYHERPVVVVEVLSDSTRRTDEHEKMEAYTAIPSLVAYLLLEQEAAAAVVYRRKGSGFGRETYGGLTAVIPLPEIDCSLPLVDVYEGVVVG